MPDLRKDPVVGRWVIIASERSKRPQDFRNEPLARNGSTCPFCSGREDLTPSEIIAYRDPHSRFNGPGWKVRVVPNKFPALQVEGVLEKRGDGIYDLMNGIGAHEVIVECPNHEISFSRLPVENIRDVLWVYRDRLLDLKRDQRLVHGLIFKNEGPLAGASLEHSHSQLIVTPVVPISIQEELDGGRQFYDYRGRCIYCDMIQQEIATGSRIVLETSNFVAFCPFASRFPFETWIVPRQHASHYESIPRQSADELADALKTVLTKLSLSLDAAPYNYVIHTAPFEPRELPHYHWHIEIMPRLTGIAGFELGSGCYINPVYPEQAASFLRENEAETPPG